MQLPSRYRSIRPAHGSLAEALENRRRLAGRLRQAASPLSAATGFRGAEACLQREPCAGRMLWYRDGVVRRKISCHAVCITHFFVLYYLISSGGQTERGMVIFV